MPDQDGVGILILWRDINALSGRRKPDITGAAAITKDDSGQRDRENGICL